MTIDYNPPEITRCSDVDDVDVSWLLRTSSLKINVIRDVSLLVLGNRSFTGSLLMSLANHPSAILVSHSKCKSPGEIL